MTGYDEVIAFSSFDKTGYNSDYSWLKLLTQNIFEELFS